MEVSHEGPLREEILEEARQLHSRGQQLVEVFDALVESHPDDDSIKAMQRSLQGRQKEILDYLSRA